LAALTAPLETVYRWEVFLFGALSGDQERKLDQFNKGAVTIKDKEGPKQPPLGSTEALPPNCLKLAEGGASC